MILQLILFVAVLSINISCGQELSPKDCKDIECPFTGYALLCGVNKNGVERTFVNECLLKRYACKFPSEEWIVKEDGPCKSQVHSHAMNHRKKIPLFLSCNAPVELCYSNLPNTINKNLCAVNKAGEMRLFENICELKKIRCEHTEKRWTPTRATCPKAFARQNPQFMASIESDEIWDETKSRNEGTSGRLTDEFASHVYHSLKHSKDESLNRNVCQVSQPLCQTAEPICGKSLYGEIKEFSHMCDFTSYYCSHLPEEWKVIQEGHCPHLKPNEPYDWEFSLKHLTVKDPNKSVGSACQLPPHVCTENKPVCGISSSGELKEFLNLCDFEKYDCSHYEEGWDIKSYNPCPIQSIISNNRYHSLNQPTVKDLIKSIGSACQLPPHVCTENKPVCGISSSGDLKEFLNLCDFEKYDCSHYEEGWDIKSYNPCPTPSMISSNRYHSSNHPTINDLNGLDCKLPLPLCIDKDLICGISSSGELKEFHNICDLTTHYCSHLAEGWSIKSHGRCRFYSGNNIPDKPNNKCPEGAIPNSFDCIEMKRRCRLTAGQEQSVWIPGPPVCGLNSFGESKQFNTTCDFSEHFCSHLSENWICVIKGTCAASPKPSSPKKSPVIFDFLELIGL